MDALLASKEFVYKQLQAGLPDAGYSVPLAIGGLTHYQNFNTAPWAMMAHRPRGTSMSSCTGQGVGSSG